jgi:hypothetical protein
MKFGPLLVVGLASLAPMNAFADGGTIQFQRESGAFAITVFSAPSPLTAGPSDISVFVQRRCGLAPVLDANVTLTIRADGAADKTLVQATRAAAQNKLLYAAAVNLNAAGVWQTTVTVFRNGERASVTGTMDVAPPRAIAASYWMWFALPPLAIALFILREAILSNKSAACGAP